MVIHGHVLWYDGHMNVLGIDYGTKYIGLAVGNTADKMAFPKGEIPTKGALVAIKELVQSEGIDMIVIGMPNGTSFGENIIAETIGTLKTVLAGATGKEVVVINEQSSSQIARHATEGKQAHHSRKRHEVPERVNASAAAIILQRYLDTQ